MTALTCRECTEGKHGNCDGTAWDNDADAAVACLCDDQQHVIDGLTATPLDVHLDDLRADVLTAQAALFAVVISACPGEHRIIQHRDGRAPWCPLCGRDKFGLRQGHVRA